MSVKVYENPFLNRLVNAGIYNGLQELFFAKHNVTSEGTNSYISYGLIQSFKYISGIYVKNIFSSFDLKPTDTWLKNAYNFVIISTSMTTFFSIGGMMSKVRDEDFQKSLMIKSFLFTCTNQLLFAPLESKQVENVKSVQLSFSEVGAVTAGLILSYLVPYAIQEIDPNNEIDSLNLFAVSGLISSFVITEGNIYICQFH